MPELPEVEVTRQGLLPYVPGCIVAGIRTSGKRLRIPVPDKLLHACIVGREVQSIERRAKYLLFRMAGGSVLVIHLGMTGRIGLFATSTPKARHDHLILELDNELELRFNDSRRFGSISVWPTKDAPALESAFNDRQGLEPLSDAFTAAYLLQLASTRNTPVKHLLMDARHIAGIGNIYANESLFAARINPQTPARLLSEDDWQRLVDAVRRILTQAIAAGGTTIADFLGSSGLPGYFQLELQVYQQGGGQCPRCAIKIQRTVLGGRATFFCPNCQPLKRG